MIIISSLILFASCTQKETNPFITEWETPFGTPPFERIKLEHYLPAYEEGFKQQNDNIAAIVGNPEEATFENTIVALDHSKDLLNKVSRVFSAMEGAMNNDDLQKISRKISPMITKQEDDINLNEALFKRVKQIYDKKESLGLSIEQAKLLEKYYKTFIRGGINLDTEKKDEFRKINERIALLNLEFGENVLKETNRFEMVIENESDLEGLPESAIKGASDAAEEKGYNGKWLFTIHKPSMIPFLQYSTKRDLREKIYRAYYMKGDNNDSFDNKALLAEVVNLRVRKAKMLGYNNHSEYVLEEQMAQNPDNVYNLLNKLWEPALKRAIAERNDMQKLIYQEGNDFKLEPWDWWYYAEKLKKVKYDLDESELRPYFQVENVIDGAFGLATDLWGIQFEERNDISKYQMFKIFWCFF